MHLFKRLAGGLMALVLTVSLLPSASARQYYSYILEADDAAEIASVLDGISNQTFSVIDEEDVRTYMEHFLYESDFSAINGGRFPYTNAQGYWSGKAVNDGTYYQVVSATGCFAYCKFVSQVIYGTAGVRRDLKEKAGRVTADGLKAFLEQYAQAGEHIRVDSNHSFTYVSGGENGFYYLDYAGDQNPRIWLRYTTYRNFAARCNELYKKVWLYECDFAENNGETDEPKSYEPENWMTDYVSAAEQLGLTQAGNTLDYNSSLTMAETVTLIARAHSLLTVGGVEFEAEEGQNWYEPYGEYLKENGILEDDPDYLEEATREQFVELMYAAVPEDMELVDLNPSVELMDADEINDVDAVDELCRAGILTGVEESDGTYFYPDTYIKRGEALALTTRMVVPFFRVTV